MRAVLAVSDVLFIAGIRWGLPSFRGWAADEVFPSRVLEGMRRLFSKADRTSTRRSITTNKYLA